MKTVSIRDLRNGLAGLLKRVGSGESVILQRRGKTGALLVPLSTPAHVREWWVGK